MNNLSLYHLFRLLLKNVFVIILTAAVFGVSAFSYCKYFVDEKFAATGSVLVTNGAILYETENSDSIQSSDITASINLLTTIKDILSTTDIYKKLAEELGIKCYDKELLDQAAKKSGLCRELFETHDEKPTSSF